MKVALFSCVVGVGAKTTNQAELSSSRVRNLTESSGRRDCASLI